MSLSVVLLASVECWSRRGHEVGQAGQIALDKQPILVEPEQPVSSEDLAVFTEDFDAYIAGWFQQIQRIEKLDASGQCPTRGSLVNI